MFQCKNLLCFFISDTIGQLAQLVERFVYTELVSGSIPLLLNSKTSRIIYVKIGYMKEVQIKTILVFVSILFLLYFCWKVELAKFGVYCIEYITVHTLGKQDISYKDCPEDLDYGSIEYFEWWVKEFNYLHEIDKLSKFDHWTKKHISSFSILSNLLRFPSIKSSIVNPRWDYAITCVTLLTITISTFFL